MRPDFTQSANVCGRKHQNSVCAVGRCGCWPDRTRRLSGNPEHLADKAGGRELGWDKGKDLRSSKKWIKPQSENKMQPEAWTVGALQAEGERMLKQQKAHRRTGSMPCTWRPDNNPKCQVTLPSCLRQALSVALLHVPGWLGSWWGFSSLHLPSCYRDYRYVLLGRTFTQVPHIQTQVGMLVNHLPSS